MLATLPPELLKDGFEPQTLRSRWKGKKWWEPSGPSLLGSFKLLHWETSLQVGNVLLKVDQSLKQTIDQDWEWFQTSTQIFINIKTVTFLGEMYEMNAVESINPGLYQSPQPATSWHQQSGSEAKCKYHCQLLLHQKIGPLVKVFSILSRFIGPINLANTIAMLIWLQLRQMIWLRLHQTTANCHYTKCIYFCRTFRRKSMG